MFFTVKQYSHIRGRTCISCHAQSAYLPMPSSTPQGSVSAGLPVTLCECVCGYGVVWCGDAVDWPALFLSHLCGCLSVALWWNRWPPCCSGCVLLLFLPLWAYCCQIKPSTAPSDASPIKSQLHSLHLIAYLLIPSPGSSLLAHLSISLSVCLFLRLLYLLSWLSPYLQNKLRFQLLDESCSYSEPIVR